MGIPTSKVHFASAMPGEMGIKSIERVNLK
jgi:hypothetical protein